jgi:tetratricopeptide (TPR) repeat protein
MMGLDAPSELRIPVLWGLWLNVLTKGRSEESLAWVDTLFNAASDREDDDLLVAAHSAAQVSHFWAGNLIEADKHGDAVKQRFDAQRYTRLALVTHHNPRTTAGCYHAQSLWMKGYPDRALAEYLATVEFASNHSHPFDTCFAWTLAGYVVGYRREPERISEATGNAYRISRELGIPFMEHVITPPVGAFGLHARGEFESVCRVLKGVDTQWRAVEGRTNAPNWYCLWADSLARLGDLGEARRIIGLALDQIRTPGWGEKSHLAEVLRVKGEIELLSGDVQRAEEAFLESVAWAQEQQAKSWELRTAMSLARLKRSMGHDEEALALLLPIYDWFTEGRDTKDHIEARQLLDELEGRRATH